MLKALENKLIEKFKDKDYFTRQELFAFYRNFEPELKEGTFTWRIYDLKNKNIMRSIKRGVYAISYKPKYKPGISPRIQKTAKFLFDQLPDTRHCIWETSWLNEFTQDQTSRSSRQPAPARSKMASANDAPRPLCANQRRSNA